MGKRDGRTAGQGKANPNPIEFLKKLVFFHDFDDHELRQFLAVGKWFRLPEGELIIREGTTERAFYILVRGTAEVSKTGADGRPVVLTTLQTGACFGEMAVLAETYRTANVVARSEAFVLRIEPEILSTSNVFLQLKFYRRFCETLVARLDLANKRMAGQVVDEEQALRQALVPETGQQTAATARRRPTLPAARGGWHRNPEPPAIPDPAARLQPTQLLSLVGSEPLRSINPGVADELRRLIARDGANAESRRFAELVSFDPVLCCHVLQTANAAHHRRPTPVLSIPHAMVVAGIREMEETVGRVLDEGEGEVIFSGYESVARRFWQHGVVVGRIAELLSDTICLQLEVDIFLAGVLHDLGVLALDRVCPDFYPHYIRPQAPFPDQLEGERHYIGLDHAKAAAGLKKVIWLPQVYWDIMDGHHRLNQIISSPLPTALIGLADLFAAERGAGLDNRRPDPAAVNDCYGWQLLRKHHQPFAETDTTAFANLFRYELDKSWPEITQLVPFYFQ